MAGKRPLLRASAPCQRLCSAFTAGSEQQIRRLGGAWSVHA